MRVLCGNERAHLARAQAEDREARNRVRAGELLEVAAVAAGLE